MDFMLPGIWFGAFLVLRRQVSGIAGAGSGGGSGDQGSDISGGQIWQ